MMHFLSSNNLCKTCIFNQPDKSFSRKRFLVFGKLIHTEYSYRFGQCKLHKLYNIVAYKHICKGKHYKNEEQMKDYNELFI